MDGDNRRRQNDAPQYTPSSSRYGPDQGQGRGRGYGGVDSDQYRASHLNTSPVGGRGVSGSSTYNYYQDTAHSFPASLPSNTMQYQSDYTPDRQQPSYGAFTPNLLYGVNQSTPQSGVYDTSQQFQTRQPGPMHILSDVAAPYYSAESSSASGPPLLQHQASSSSSYQPAVQSFSNSIGVGGMEVGGAGVLDQDAVVSGGLDEAYAVYQDALKQIFYNIQENRLSEAATSVLDVSNWLLSNVVRLGLTGDDESLHSDRLKLWNEFNNAWLTLFQKQKDLTQEVIRTGVAPRPPQSLITQDYLWKMSKELVRLSDGVEKHGLVDYQFGIWEENIMDKCLDLLESPDEEEADTGRGPA